MTNPSKGLLAAAAGSAAAAAALPARLFLVGDEHGLGCDEGPSGDAAIVGSGGIGLLCCLPACWPAPPPLPPPPPPSESTPLLVLALPIPAADGSSEADKEPADSAERSTAASAAIPSARSIDVVLSRWRFVTAFPAPPPSVELSVSPSEAKRKLREEVSRS